MRPIAAGIQSNGFAGTKASDNAGQARKETEPIKNYILLPLWTADPPYSQDPKSSHDDGSKPSSDDGKKVDENLRKDSKCKDQEKEDTVNSTNTVNVAGINEVNVVGGKISIKLPFDPNTSALEAYLTSQEMMKMMVFKNKNDERGIVKRNKARLVTQGYTQEEEIDYDEAFALVSRIEANRLFLAYTSFKDFMVYQMDVKSVFLYGKIEEEVYVCQPPIFEDPNFPNRVYKVEKALYGLHQARRAWYETLSTYLLDNRFQRGKIGKTLFIKRHKGDILMEKKDGIFITQDKYVVEILKKFGFTEVKTASTPMETQKLLLKDEDVCACNRYQVNLKVSHLHAMKRIFRYLNSQPKLGLWYLKDYPFDLVAYTDSDYAGTSLDKKSTIGGKEKKSVKLMMEKLFRMELELMLFWSTVKAKTINGEVQLYALVDGKKIIITETTIRRDLQLEDAEGVDCLPNSTIFEKLTLMGSKTTTWNEFSSTMESAIIYLAINQNNLTESVAHEVVHEELGDSMVRAATTSSSLEAEQDS
ncbi:putative ribonuclease H-like domain-containing protein, partial [Tanacetum coccineum]